MSILKIPSPSTNKKDSDSTQILQSQFNRHFIRTLKAHMCVPNSKKTNRALINRIKILYFLPYALEFYKKNIKIQMTKICCVFFPFVQQ